MRPLVLITGGAGFIGSKLTGALLDDGFRIRVLEYDERMLDNVSQHFDKSNFEYLLGDVTDEDDVERACDGATHIVHLAGIASVNACKENPKQAIEINGYAARRLLEEARKNDEFQRFLFPSSVAGMYTKPEQDVITEEHPVYPVNDYGVSKFLGETYCKAYGDMYGVESVIFRQSNIYGPSPGMSFNIVPHIFAQNALEGKPLTIYGSGKQSRDFLYLDDLVDAYVAAIKSDALEGVFNLCKGDVYTIEDLAHIVQEAVADGTGEEVEIKREEMDGSEAEIRKFGISNQKARDQFGFDPEVGLEEGIGRLVEEINSR